MNREIVIDKNMFERNAHGSFGFPINLLHIVMSDYPFGRFNGHWHPEIEITYIADGEMQYHVNEVAYTLKKGDCIFVNRNVLHAGAVDPGTDCIFIVFDFNPILVTGYENSVIDEKYVSPVLNAESFSSCIFTGGGAAHASIQQLVAQMEQHYTGREECYELTIKSILNAIWVLIYRQFTALAADAGTRGESKLIQRAKKALTFIYEHYSEPITLDEMASACHTSKSEFCRLFKAAMRGEQQIGAQIEHNEIDLVIFLRDPLAPKAHEPDVSNVMRLCDMHNIPLATNLASAELLIKSLDRGDLEWREMYK